MGDRGIWLSGHLVIEEQGRTPAERTTTAFWVSTPMPLHVDFEGKGQRGKCREKHSILDNGIGHLQMNFDHQPADEGGSSFKLQAPIHPCLTWLQTEFRFRRRELFELAGSLFDGRPARHLCWRNTSSRESIAAETL